MKTFLSYLGLTIAFAVLATGAVVSAFMDLYAKAGLNILWLVLPVTLLFMTAVFIDVKFAIPRLLSRIRKLSDYLRNQLYEMPSPSISVPSI